MNEIAKTGALILVLPLVLATLLPGSTTSQEEGGESEPERAEPDPSQPRHLPPPPDWGDKPVPGPHDKSAEACMYYGYCLPMERQQDLDNWHKDNPGKRGYTCQGMDACWPEQDNHLATCFVHSQDGKKLELSTNHGYACGAHCREQCCGCCTGTAPIDLKEKEKK